MILGRIAQLTDNSGKEQLLDSLRKAMEQSPPGKVYAAVEQVDIGKCRVALSRLARGDFRMCIPPQKDDDDVILSAALDELFKYRVKYGPLTSDPISDIQVAIEEMSGKSGYFPSQEEIEVEYHRLFSACKVPSHLLNETRGGSLDANENTSRSHR